MTLAFRHLISASNGDTEIAGKGLRVYTVLGLYETGDSPEYIADAYNVPLAAVHEALAYAADNPDEMEAIRRADEAADQDIFGQVPEQVREDAWRVVQKHEQQRLEAVRRTREARLGTAVS